MTIFDYTVIPWHFGNVFSILFSVLFWSECKKMKISERSNFIFTRDSKLEISRSSEKIMRRSLLHSSNLEKMSVFFQSFSRSMKIFKTQLFSIWWSFLSSPIFGNIFPLFRFSWSSKKSKNLSYLPLQSRYGDMIPYSEGRSKFFVSRICFSN